MEIEEDYRLTYDDFPEPKKEYCSKCGQYHILEEDCGYEKCDRCGNYFHYSELRDLWFHQYCRTCYIWEDDD